MTTSPIITAVLLDPGLHTPGIGLLADLARVAAAAPRPRAGDGWLTRNATLVVGVVGIVVSGFVGPTVVSFFTSRREREKDRRALLVARQDDLRTVLDEAAAVLSRAISKLRPLLAAALAERELPKEPADFLGSLAPLGHRLQLRMPGDSAVCLAFDDAVQQLRTVATSTASQADFEAAVDVFDEKLAAFLKSLRDELQADIFDAADSHSRKRD